MKTSKRNFRGFLFLLNIKNTILYLFYSKKASIIKNQFKTLYITQSL
jgi:hypothetical protein